MSARPRHRALAWPALLAAIGAALSCFSERQATTGPDNGGVCDSPPGPNVVHIRDFEFRPAQLTVTQGATVTFINCGREQHTATEDDRSWDSSFLAPGQSFTHTFGQEGTFGYFCEPHTFMRGSIVVQ